MDALSNQQILRYLNRVIAHLCLSMKNIRLCIPNLLFYILDILLHFRPSPIKPVAEKRKVSAATLLREEWDTDTAENS